MFVAVDAFFNFAVRLVEGTNKVADARHRAIGFLRHAYHLIDMILMVYVFSIRECQVEKRIKLASPS